MANASYNYSDYLYQVPDYQRKDESVLKNRATTAANLVFDPQKAEQERAAQWNEAMHINNMRKLKTGNVGTYQALALSNAQARRAANIRAANSGAIGASGLTDYLNNQADIQTEAQRLNIAATLAANNAAEVNSFDTTSRQDQSKLSDIEKFRGQTSSSLYDQYNSAEDDRENAWRQNALQVALGIGSGEMQAADINQRADTEAARIAQMKYDTDMGYKIAQLPYDKMTQYDQARTYLDSANIFGQAPGGGSSYSSGGGGGIGILGSAMGSSGSSSRSPSTQSNQYKYLLSLANQGGGNAEWARTQLAAGNY